MTWHIRQKIIKQIQTKRLLEQMPRDIEQIILANKNVKMYTATHLVLQSSAATDLT